MSKDTKNKIIEVGAQIMHHKGYHHTGIQEVLSAAGVPKGSFYFYFKNKEDFGLHVIEFFDQMFLEMIKPIIENDRLTPLQKLGAVLDHFTELFISMEYQCGCPVGNLSQELGDLNEAFSERLSESVEKMTGIYKSLLDDAVINNEISKHIDTHDTAEFIVSSWHGALIKMKINRTVDPLKLHKKMVLSLLQT